MYDVSGLQPNRKEVAAAILIVFILLVVAGSIGYMLGVRNAGSGVHDNGNGIDNVGGKLEEAGTAIGVAKNGIDAAAGSAEKVGAGINAAQESAGYIQHTADTSAELIGQCQSIIDGIRARGQAGKATH